MVRRGRNLANLTHDTAVHIVTRTTKSDNITPVLQHLHRLPMKAWFHYEILRLTLKALPGFRLATGTKCILTTLQQDLSVSTYRDVDYSAHQNII